MWLSSRRAHRRSGFARSRQAPPGARVPFDDNAASPGRPGAQLFLLGSAGEESPLQIRVPGIGSRLSLIAARSEPARREQSNSGNRNSGVTCRARAPFRAADAAPKIHRSNSTGQTCGSPARVFDSAPNLRKLCPFRPLWALGKCPVAGCCGADLAAEMPRSGSSRKRFESSRFPAANGPACQT